MIEMSLRQSDPVAVSRSPLRQARSVVAYSLLMALMIMLRLPVFVPAVVLYAGIRFGTRAVTLSLFGAALLATLSVTASNHSPDVLTFDYLFVTLAVLALGVPAVAAIPFVERGESFGRVLILLVAGGALGIAATEVVWRAAAGSSAYALFVAQARVDAVAVIQIYKARGFASDVVALIERSLEVYTSKLVAGGLIVNAAMDFTLSLLMVGRLPAGRALAAKHGAETYQLRSLSLPDGVLFLFVFGGIAPLTTGALHVVAANVLTLAVFLYVLQGFALLRFLLASLGVGFIGALVAAVLTWLTLLGPLLLGVVGLFDPFFDFRHFKKRKDDSHESHSD
jgi:hypothetical protein